MVSVENLTDDEIMYAKSLCDGKKSVNDIQQRVTNPESKNHPAKTIKERLEYLEDAGFVTKTRGRFELTKTGKEEFC